MKITGFYVQPQRKPGAMAIKRARKLISFCGAAFVAMGTGAVPALAAESGTVAIGKAAAATFGPGGPGSMIIQLMLIAVVGWLAGYVAQAAGKGQISGMIHVATIFSCISIVAGTAMKAIDAVGKFIG